MNYILIFLLFTSLSLGQELKTYLPSNDELLAKMYPHKDQTYRLLFGKSFVQIKTHNPSLNKKLPKDVFSASEVLYYPMICVQKEDWHALYLSSNERTVIINKKSLVLFLYVGNELVLSTYVSEGTRGRPRIKESFITVSEKSRYRRSRRYRNAPMPFAFHLYEGRYMHAGEVITGNDSHGCIRIPYVYAREIFSLITMGDKIIIKNPPN